MDSSGIHIEVRRPWRSDETIFLLGPGGVGKSTLGRALGAQLNWPVIDLDVAFFERLGPIGDFISTQGYQRYRAENLALAKQLQKTITRSTIFVTASGFLAGQRGTSDHLEARDLVSTGYGITLLPSLDLELATETVVERQLKRGFGLQRESEDRKFRERFDIYRKEGDALVASTHQPARIAAALIFKAGIIAE